MERFNVDEPRWDQRTFTGRLKHFANITDPRAAFVPTKDLLAAKNLIELYRLKREPSGISQPQLFRAQKLYQSAFHPDTGELQNVIGRMSFQVPGGTVLIAAMIMFYRTNTSVIFWQWANQSFNALVNYTNRNAKSTVTPGRIALAYCTATSAALVTALGLKAFLSQRAGSLAQRLVPLAAVFAANCVNIPLMRQNELSEGLTLVDERGEERGKSRLAALKAITLVVISRNVIAAPAMLFTPIFMEKCEKMLWFQKNRRILNQPMQVLSAAGFLLFMVPIGCALFPQKNHVSLKALEKYEPKCFKGIVEKESNKEKLPEFLYFNKVGRLGERSRMGYNDSSSVLKWETNKTVTESYKVSKYTEATPMMSVLKVDAHGDDGDDKKEYQKAEWWMYVIISGLGFSVVYMSIFSAVWWYHYYKKCQRKKRRKKD